MLKISGQPALILIDTGDQKNYNYRGYCNGYRFLNAIVKLLQSIMKLEGVFPM
jgi:hypothetical protein